MKEIEKQYIPTDNAIKIIKLIYDEFTVMREVVSEKFGEFNDRTLKEFVDDCQKRANSYVPSKREQGKDDWQANVFTPTTRNKVKALIGSIAKEPPAISMTAFNEQNQTSQVRAEIMKNLVEASYVQHDNPEKSIFLDGWNCAINGTVIKYDGYLKVKDTVKVIKNYDPITGEVEYEEQEEVVEDRPIEIDIPLSHLFVRNAYISDIQDQPSLICVDYLDEDQFDFEWKHFKNAVYVQSQGELLGGGDSATFFLDKWKDRVGKKKIELIRYYRKFPDRYVVIANGVLLLDAPLLWGKIKKRYPFVKEIYEPFANANFFWGNSLPNILMGEQDIENALINSMVDKTYRSMEVPMLVGLGNKDAFDLEDEWVTSDTKIYVDDVNQVKPMPISQVNQSEIAMLRIIQSGLENDSTDKVQGGAVGSGSTAREVVIANERAEELKGLFFTMMKSLWLQKYRLRSLNILMNYNIAKVTEVVGEDGVIEFQKQFKVFHIPNAQLSSGGIGNLQIEVMGNQAELLSSHHLETRELTSRMEGRPVEIIQMTSNFLDDYEYQIKIESDSIYQKTKSLKMALATEKITGVAQLFPEIFMSNKNKFFKSYMEGFGDNPDKYLEGMNTGVSQVQGMGGSQQQGMPPPQRISSSQEQLMKLPALSGI